MYENRISPGSGRGRGRGRGRGVWRPNTDVEASSAREMWDRGDRLSNPSKCSSSPSAQQWGQPSMTFSKPSETVQIYNRQTKKEERPALTENLPPPTSSNLENNRISSNQPKKGKSLQQPSHHALSPPCTTPSLSSSPSSSFSFGSSSSADRYSSSNSLSSTFLSSDRPHISPPENMNLPGLSQECKEKQRYRRDLNRMRQINLFPEKGDVRSSPQKDQSSNSRQQRRANKRPVNSPTDETNLPQANVRPSGSHLNKKKKKKRKTEGETVNSENKSTTFIHKDLLSLTVSENKTFSEQTEELISQLEQTPLEKNLRLIVLRDVAETFAPHLPLVEPQIYGSTLTNIAFKSSDLDIFLFCPQGQPEYNFVSEKGRLMYKSSKFRNVVRVPRARVPVIKATHIMTNVDVDISTMSGQAVYNSLLIKHILSLDSRFRPLAMLISLWSKLNTITGQSRFTSYSIVLMLIYYLQKTDPPFLPPLKDILYSNTENSWPNYFREEPLEIKNYTDISQLFKGFFAFYANFNFEELVISPYLGREIRVSQFKNLDELPKELDLYKHKLEDNTSPFLITNLIHVQDPMEHNVNTTKGVFQRLLKLFRRSCERFLQNSRETIPKNRWLPLILKQQPLKIMDEKKIVLTINYPNSDKKDWFEKCKTDFRHLLKVLLIRSTEDESNDETAGRLKKDSFLAESNYNVFNKKFRSPLRMYMSGTIPLKEMQKQFEMQINRMQAPNILFKTRFLLEKISENGRIKVTIIDKNTTGLNSFSSLAAEFKRYCYKLLTDITNKGEILIEPIDSNVELVVSGNGSQTKVKNEENNPLLKTELKNDKKSPKKMGRAKIKTTNKTNK